MDTLLEPNVEFNEGTDDMDFNLDWKDGFVDTPVLPQTISSANPLAAWNSFATANPGPSVHGKGSKSTPNNKSQKLPKAKRKKQSPTATNNESPGDSNALSGGLGPTRIRRQYNCESCSFRTINPREFLYHRRDFHGAKVKIVECPYCVYACQYFQKLQRHILLVHKLETVTTPPPSVSSTNSSSHGNQQNSDCKKSQSGPGDAAACSSSLNVNSTSSKAASSKQVIKKSHPATSSNQTILKSHPFNENDDDDTADHGLVMDESDVDEMNAIDEVDDPLESLVELNAIFEDRPEGQVIKCRKCGYATDVKALFRAHVADHSAPKNKCDQCNFESAYAYIVKQHAEKEHSKNSSLITLQNESAQNTSQLTNNNSTYTCSKCAFTTDSPQLHSQHVASCHLRDTIEEEDNFSSADSSKNVDDNNEAIGSTTDAPFASKGKC